MQRLPKPLSNNVILTAAIATYFTVPDNSLLTVNAMSATNTTSIPRLLNVFRVPVGAAAGAGNPLCWSRVIAPGETFNVHGAIGQTWAAGWTIQASSDAAASVNLETSGYITIP